MRNLQYLKRTIILAILIMNAGCIVTIYAQTAWEEMEPMQVARGGSASCVIDTKIYVFGGAGATSDYITINTAEVYNIETNQWSELAPIPIDVYETNVEAINNKIYLAGGFTGDLAIDSTFEYNPEDNSWKTLKACPVKTGTNSSCVFNDTL